MPFSLRDDPMTLRAIIMDHYQNPRNKREVNDERYKTVHMDSSSCIDDIYVQLLMEDGVVQDVCWHGVSCAISTASTSIMTTLIMGKKEDEANYIMANFNEMINEEEFDEECLGEAIAFINTSKQASRIKCATIGWRGLKELFDEEGKEHVHDED